jgi:predicted Zn-dependent protease
LKWEVTAEQSAQKKSELDPDALRRDLAFLVEHYQQDTPQQIPLGTYDVVFGSAAIAEMISFMSWIGFSGGALKRGFSFLNQSNLGQKVFSTKFFLTDDPNRLETYPFKQDLTGITRQPYPIFSDGVFNSFTWSQDDADEFGAVATGHTVMHNSLVVSAGKQQVASLHELLGLSREKDILYIPFLHYMNIVNPSKGTITGSSRFGALLLKADGSVIVPYNVRLTQSLLDIFGDKVAWFSSETVAYNTSSSYGARNPSAVIVPRFMRVNDLEISHSNSSY